MRILKLEDICDSITDGKHGDCQNEEGSQFYFLSAKDIREGKIFYENGRRITKKDYLDTNRRTRFESNDILITNTGASVGRFAIAKEDERIYRTTFQKSVSLLKVNPIMAYPEYIYYSLLSKKKEIINLGGGSAQANLLLRDIRSYKITLPELKTQKKIASILSNYDELIENNKRRIALLEEMAAEIYKEWFVRLRFPNWKHTKIVDGIPDGWELQALSNVIEYYIGGGWGQEEKDATFSEPAYVVRGTDMPKVNIGDVSTVVYRFHKKSNLKARSLQNGDIIFEVSGGTETQWLGRTVLILQDILDRLGQQVMCASFCKLIRPNEKVNSSFLYHYLNRIYATGEVSIFQVQSTGISNFQFEDFLKYQKILVPDDKTLNLFEEIILPIQKEVQILGEKNTTLQKTRDLLLPRLVSGKLSVAHLIETAEAKET